MKDGLLNEKKCGYIYRCSKNKILPVVKKIYKTIIEKHKTRFFPLLTHTKYYYYLLPHTIFVVYTKNNNNIYNTQS